MTIYAAEFEIANHWPLIERSLLWRQASAQHRALEVLAYQQVEHLGAPVPLGRKRLSELLEASAGEATAMIHALGELECRGVVKRSIGHGPTPSTWSFTTDVTRWRGRTWSSSSTSIAALVSGCQSVTVLATASQFPDQGPQQRHTSPFLPECRDSNHVISTFFVEEVSRFRERCDARDLKPSGKPVELSRWRDEKNFPLHSSKESLSKESLSLEGLDPERRTTAQILIDGVAKCASAGGSVWPRSATERQVIDFAHQFNSAQAMFVVECWESDLARGPRKTFQTLVNSIPALATSKEAAGLERAAGSS